MKISVKLINSYLKKHLNTGQMAEALESTEVEVEEILYAKKLDSKIIVARVLEVTLHPNANMLKIAKVDTGIGVVSVVCGATNIEANIIVALAQIGTILPSGDEIKEVEIRGERSHGMLCSELEMGWGEDHSGIVVLPPSLPLGQSLCDIDKISDTIDIKTPSNRWDYLSYIGLAREIAATQADNSLIEPGIAKITYHDREVAKVKQSGQCHAFYLTKLRVSPDALSPQWLVDNLQAAGLRTINAVVDITNFIMLEYGQPSHAYDASKIAGDFGVRFAKPGESLTTLDGKLINLSSQDLVVVDNSGPIGLAGVIGGQSTATSSDTSEIWIEVANFDKTTIRKSALRYGIRTEASSRFERGLPLPLPDFATRRIIGLLQSICNAEVIDSPTRQVELEYNSFKLGMRIRKAEKFLGFKLDEKEVIQILAKRGFKPVHFSLTKAVKALGSKLESSASAEVLSQLFASAGILIGASLRDQIKAGMEVPDISLKPGDVLFLSSAVPKAKRAPVGVGIFIGKNRVMNLAGKTSIVPVTKYTKSKLFLGARRYLENFNHIISVEVPWWRNDISIESDLFEEVAKALGYAAMPATLPEIQNSNTADHQLLPSLMVIREKLSSLGLIEVMTYSFVSKFDVDNISSDSSKNLQIENPLSSEQDFLRTSLVSSHLRVVNTNQTSRHDGIFEISRVYEHSQPSPKEKWVLTVSIWHEHSLARIKGVLDDLFGWQRQELVVARIVSKLYIPNRSGSILPSLGEFGQLSPTILRQYEIDTEVAIMNIEIQKIIESKPEPKALPRPTYQIIYRDLTIELADVTIYQSISRLLVNKFYSVRYKVEFQNDELKKSSKKRLTITIGIDLGPNPTSAQINEKISLATKLIRLKIKARVL
ncbi:hypothetical protein EXS66_00975 [Candidatus Saccharibacteria bacterium]|nr:hypothetical protein [Candidatus Saccharibacteria bacterium]